MRTERDAPASTAPHDRLRLVAADMVRKWGRQDVASMSAEIGAIGLRAVETSVRAISRLRVEGPEASRALAALVVLVEAIEVPPSRRWSFLRSASGRGRIPISALVDMVERERDEALRLAMTLREDRRRLEAAENALEDATVLIGMLDAGAVAAARELANEDPARAEILRTLIRAHLSERCRDLVNQLVVLRQALATCDLLADGQGALLEALERARNLTLSAAHTAIAARATVGSDAAPSGGARSGSTSLGDVVARLHAILDRRERG